MRHHKASWQHTLSPGSSRPRPRSGNTRKLSGGRGMATEISPGHCQPEIPRILCLLKPSGPKVRAGIFTPEISPDTHPSLPILSLLLSSNRNPEPLQPQSNLTQLSRENITLRKPHHQKMTVMITIAIPHSQHTKCWPLFTY